MAPLISVEFIRYAIELSSLLFLFTIGFISVSYLFFTYYSYKRINKYKDEFSPYEELPVSIIVPFFNQETTIVDSVKSFLKQDYKNKEIILVNDGSKDNSLNLVIENFNLIDLDFPLFKEHNDKIKKIYYNHELNLFLIDKLNGGKADAINCGLLTSSNDYFCVVDGDSILKLDALKKTMFYFANNPKTIAVGSTIRDVNGLVVENGEIKEYNIPDLLIEKFQHVEYLKSFLIIRSGLDFFKSNLIISGAFGCFRKSSVLNVGGFSLNHLGEDMDLIFKLHKNKKDDEEIRFIPEALCLTQVPYDQQSLKKQRIRWQRGLIQSIFSNKDIEAPLIFKTTKRFLTFLSVPFFILSEIIAPLFFSFYWLLMIVAFFFDMVVFQKLVFLGFISLLYNVLLSILIIYINEKTFPSKMKEEHFLELVFISVLESFGYRQLITYYKLLGIRDHVLNKGNNWGTIIRKKF